MPREMRNSMIWLVLGSAGCLLAYWFIDQPVAFLVFNEHINKIYFLKELTFIPVFLVGLTVIFYPLLAIRFCLGKYGLLERHILLFANAISATYLLKTVLKIVFARYWPMTWIHNNPSLIHNGIYGFKWFHMGPAYGAFPSGHAAVMTAGMVALSLSYPKWSWLFGLLWFLVAIGLVGMNYHFVGDVIGGATLGGAVAWATKYSLDFTNYREAEKSSQTPK